MRPTGGLPQLGVAGSERTAAARSSFALPQSSIREVPDRGKWNGPATTLRRDHGTHSTTLRKRGKRAKLVSCHECRGT